MSSKFGSKYSEMLSFMSADEPTFMSKSGAPDIAERTGASYKRMVSVESFDEDETSCEFEAVILLCGIPGSGKSSFAHDLLQEHHSASGKQGSVLISYDDALPPQEEWDEDTYESTRSKAFGMFEHIIDAYQKKSRHTLLSGVIDPQNNKQKQNNSSYSGVLVVDDNMYLNSMRREIYKKCRQVALPLITIWVDVSLEEALRRNEQREVSQVNHVSVEAITSMHQAFEPPQTKNVWDRSWFVVGGGGGGSGGPRGLDRADELQKVLDALPAAAAQRRQEMEEFLLQQEKEQEQEQKKAEAKANANTTEGEIEAGSCEMRDEGDKPQRKGKSASAITIANTSTRGRGGTQTPDQVIRAFVSAVMRDSKEVARVVHTIIVLGPGDGSHNKAPPLSPALSQPLILIPKKRVGDAMARAKAQVLGSGIQAQEEDEGDGGIGKRFEMAVLRGLGLSVLGEGYYNDEYNNVVDFLKFVEVEGWRSSASGVLESELRELLARVCLVVEK